MPGEERDPVYWNNELVGSLENLGIDNFHWYGKWIPAESSATQLFLAEIANYEITDNPDYLGNGLWIGIGHNKPMVEISYFNGKQIEAISFPDRPTTW